MQRERRSSLFLLFFWRLVPVVKEEEGKERSLSALPPPLPVSADEGSRFDGEFTQSPCFLKAFVGGFPSCSFVAAKFQCRRGFLLLLLLLLLSLHFCANRPPKKLFFLLTSGIVDIQFWGLDDANIFSLVLCMSPACGFATDSPSSQQISSRPLFHEKLAQRKRERDGGF